MLRKAFRRAWLGVVLALLVPRGAWAQDYAPEAVPMPWPLYSTHPANGGLFLTGGFAMYQQTNPLKDQQIAYRGFLTVLPGINDVNGNPIPSNTFVGSRDLALDTNQVQGPAQWQPGFVVEGGWRFSNGSALSVGFLFLSNTSYRAAATLAPPGLNVRVDQSDSFLTAFVYNFPPEFAGPPQKLSQGPPGATFGIWNAASIMTEYFVQRGEQLEATYRVPVYENETYRISGLIGPRFFWIYDHYNWTTTDIASIGLEDPSWVGVYDNIVNNRMYGIHAGCQQEWYLGYGFAAMLGLQGAAFVDMASTQAEYQRAIRYAPPQMKRVTKEWTAVPEIQATPALMWYPLEGVQIQVLYDAFVFFNTVASPRPVDFNYGAVDPGRERIARFFQGFQANIAFIF
jgi:hypothetical protein